MNYRKLKVVTIVGTRPEIIRLSRILAELDKYFDHILVHTGQNYDYELSEVFFDDLDIKKPNYFLNCALPDNTAAKTIGNIISKVDDLLSKQKPDALLILGDTNSCLSVISAKRRKIPIFHMEAGNRCFDDRVPEEINRRIVDHTSDINLTYSNIARSYLLREGLDPAKIVKVGSPMTEVIYFYYNKIKNSKILEKINLKPKTYFLVSAHREENIEDDKMFDKFCRVLNYLAEKGDKKVVVSTHPRTKAKIENSNFNFSKQILFLNPLSYTDYNNLQISALCVLSDSGTITEESSILNFPALNIRETHERPEGMEEGAVMFVGFNINLIDHGLKILKNQKNGAERTIMPIKDYQPTNVSEKVVRIILSYIDYINRETWKKSE